MGFCNFNLNFNFNFNLKIKVKINFKLQYDRSVTPLACAALVCSTWRKPEALRYGLVLFF